MPPFPEEEDPGAVRPPLVLRESGLPPGVVLPVDESPAEEVSEGWVPVDGVVSYSSPPVRFRIRYPSPHTVCILINILLGGLRHVFHVVIAGFHVADTVIDFIQRAFHIFFFSAGYR